MLGRLWKKPLLRAEQCSAFRFCRGLDSSIAGTSLVPAVLFYGGEKGLH
jgi:hypothetical protein